MEADGVLGEAADRPCFELSKAQRAAADRIFRAIDKGQGVTMLIRGG